MFYCSKSTLCHTGFNGEFKINNLLCMNVEMNVMDYLADYLGQKNVTYVKLNRTIFLLLLLAIAAQPDVIIGDVIKKKPEVIDLLDSGNELENIAGSNGDAERRKKHGKLTKRLHKR